MYKKHHTSYYSVRTLKDIIEKRFNIINFTIILLFSIIVIGLIILQVGKRELYTKKLASATSRIIESNSVPRGRIYDRNYNLLVDNIGRRVIYYKKNKNISVRDEISLAYKISNIINLPYQKLNITNLKEFWLANNPVLGNKKITEEEYQQYKMRKLTSSNIRNLKINRITDNDLSIYNDNDKKAAYLYYLMNKGYSYDEKIIKESDVTDTEYAYISENNEHLSGFNTKLEWERKYLYGDTLRSVLGNVSNSTQGIPYELKDYYLNKGYSLNDRVGLSYLEYQYEDLLKGQKGLFKINNDNSYELIQLGIRGHDIVLSIDINLQLAIEQILKEEMVKAKREPNTDYYNKSMVVVSNPNTGEILAYVAKQIVLKDGEYKIYDYTPYIATTPIVVGSVIKGASMTVGYNTKAIDIGTKFFDECIKLKNTPPKCSWQRSGLGTLDDIGALVYSSNVYQFKTAMRVAGVNYSYNQALVVSPASFQVYRDTFAEYGLGVKTGIDLPLESTGYKGGNTVAGHLLDFAIGQYDTYTTIELAQYINTVANKGTRYKLNLLKEVHEPTMSDVIGPKINSIEPSILNKVKIESKYMDRIRIGFKSVMNGPLGRNYMGSVPNVAGKTGTSQSFVDTDGDSRIDKETISKTFAGYYPADNPHIAMVVVSPDVSHRYKGSSFDSQVNKRIAARVSEKCFELFK